MSPHKREHCILLNYATCTRWKHRSYIKIFASPLKKKKIDLDGTNGFR